MEKVEKLDSGKVEKWNSGTVWLYE